MRLRLGDWWVSEDGAGSPLLDSDIESAPLPLGAVVATCRLVDIVRIDWGWAGRVDRLHPELFPRRGWSIEQRAFGDFSPGRYAWVLADVEPVDPPIPAKGRQGLWEWS